MNKKLKIFILVIYLIFTFGIGILMAFALPGLLMTVDLPGHIEDYLSNGEYARCVNLLAGYNDKEIAYQKTFEDGSGIVLFRTLVLIENTEEDAAQEDNAYFAYSGFIYNLQGKYETYQLVNNKTRLIANYDSSTYEEGKGKADGLTKNVEIDLLGYDTNKDGMYDNILTLVKYNYVYFEVLEKRTSNITGLTFIDCKGNVFMNVDGLSLDFSDVFYTSLTEFMNVYNANSKDDALIDLQANFLRSNENYQKCSYQEETAIASRKGAIYVLIYFIIIYFLMDILLWPHFTNRFVSWIIHKIKKKMGKEDEVKIPSDVYGSDYYTQLTITLKVPLDCGINVTIHYHNETDEINMIFSKDNNYSVSQRTHAGVYLNAWLEAPGYVSENLPKSLPVRGYKMNVEVSLRKAEENENIPTENLSEKEKEE